MDREWQPHRETAKLHEHTAGDCFHAEATYNETEAPGIDGP